MIKCVVWDLDDTLTDGVFLESGTLTPRDGVADTLRRLTRRGIVHSIASRNPPEAAKTIVDKLDLPEVFLFPQFSWDAKSLSLRRIAEALNFAPSTLAFVDDDPYERAEVTANLPEVLVLSPDDVDAAVDWPAFNPPSVTPEARRRARSYAEARQRDRVAREFTGSREDFQRFAGLTITLRRPVAADVPRLAELSRRTSRFNSRGAALTESRFTELLASPRHTVICVDLRDRFGDDGTVGAVVAARGAVWEAELVMMSCRAIGRGVIETVLSWLGNAARGDGAEAVRVVLRVSERNLPLRLALVAAGYRADADRDGEAVFAREAPAVDEELADWVKVETGT